MWNRGKRDGWRTAAESILVLTPSVARGVQIAVAAARAGEIGIADLAGAAPDGIEAAARRLARTGGSWGVRWDASTDEGAGPPSLPVRIPILVLAGTTSDRLAGALGAAREIADRVVLEVRCAEMARAAEAAGCDGVLLKGHEAGGAVGSLSSFILAQKLYRRLSIPHWIQGGVGLHTAGAVRLTGTGLALCEQLWLTPESPLTEVERRLYASLDGSETVVVGEGDRLYRFLDRCGRDTLQAVERALAQGRDWEALLPGRPEDPVVPMGQDIAFASYLAERHETVAGILGAYRHAADQDPRLAASQQALSSGSPLAASHGTRFPIVQGPMTRVSDNVAFSKAVAEAGGLPFFALAFMRGPDVRRVLDEARAHMGETPWGVGILGFLPPELQQEQRPIIDEVRPPFAIIAGGQPAQAAELEARGTQAYLHAPSPGLLGLFVDQGARKLVVEGSECGGHTGPRTSFVLWDLAVEALLERDADTLQGTRLLFAGGIHDALSAAMVATVASPLVARGVEIGILMGTAYLFTEEVVRSGAILEEFQKQALDCEETVLLRAGVGYTTRCARTAIADDFEKTRKRLVREGNADEDVRWAMELFNVGRLRAAAKGVVRNPNPEGEGERDRYVPLDTEAQRRKGLYMLGDVATLEDGVRPLSVLHTAVSEGAENLLRAHVSRRTTPRPRDRTRDIAIVGMGCLLPQSPDVHTYWRNIVESRCAVEEVPDDRWSKAEHFTTDRGDTDRVYSKWGCFLDDLLFDPTRFGITPISLRSIEPLQLLSVEVSRMALEDAAAHGSGFPRARTAVIFGAGGSTDLQSDYVFRTQLRAYMPNTEGISEEVRRRVLQSLEDQVAPWTEDSFPGTLLSVIAGRVANRLDLGGGNYTVDAACAAALAALEVGMMKLRSRHADVALVGGADGTNNLVGFMAFARTHALSPRGRICPFDDEADGIVMGEGVAALVLKRLEDAERDGNRIHAVLKGIGSSGDGRHRSLVAPHGRGQMRALRRAYEDAGVDPSSVELIEAHGTGTAVGDPTEIEALTSVLGGPRCGGPHCAIGSVKSMIGHTKMTAGLAGVVKGALALQQHVLPPTLGVETPNTRVDFEKTPLYVNSETRPWIHDDEETPRRCGVSAFGFGGTNFHAVLEEHEDSAAERPDMAPRPVEIVTLARGCREEIVESASGLLERLRHPTCLDLPRFAAALHAQEREAESRVCRLAILAASGEDLRDKLEWVLEELARSGGIRARGGVFYEEGGEAAGTVCFLFPGQGSQRVDMMRDLVTLLPEHQRLFETADRCLADRLPQPLSRYVYPRPVFTDRERAHQQAALDATHVAQPALGVVNLVAFDVLDGFGLRPDFAAGHSFGEYVALCAAGVLSRPDLIRLSEVRGRLVTQASASAPGTMLSVLGSVELVLQRVRDLGLSVELANVNAPDQTVLGGRVDAVEAAARALQDAGLTARRIPVTAAFHTSAMADAADALSVELRSVGLRAPRTAVFSNTLADRYPESPEAIRDLLADHMRRPVRFADEVVRLHEAGARVFLEVGPGATLTGLVTRTLGDRPYTALSLDVPGRDGMLQLAHLLGRCFALGLPVDLTRWYARRPGAGATVEEVLEAARRRAEPAPTVWRLNVGRADPVASPERDAPVRRRPPSAVSRSPLLEETLDRLVTLQQEQQELTRRLLELQERTVAEIEGPREVSSTPRPTALPPRKVKPSRGVTLPSAAPPLPGLRDAKPTRAPETKREERVAPDESLESALLRTVSKRTGYPVEMLDMDAHMEADLGIDSIKRMEILGALGELSGVLDDATAGGRLEAIGSLRTLRSIVAWYERHRSQGRKPAAPPATTERGASTSAPIGRYVVRPVACPPDDADGATAPPREHLLLLVGEVPGLTEALRVDLEGRGHPVRTVIPGTGTRDLGDDRFAVDLSSPDAVDTLRRMLSAGGRTVGAIVHLAGLASESGLESEPAGLFLLLKTFESDLRRSAVAGGGRILSITSMDGRLGLTGPASFPVRSAGTLGVTKSVAREWPEVACRCVDLDPSADPARMAARIVRELDVRDGPAEVGLSDQGRITLELGERNGAAKANGSLDLPPDAVLLVTGGALGITAEITKALAGRHRPRLVVVGRSPVPTREPESLRGLREPGVLRTFLIDEHAVSGQSATPAEIEQHLQRILKGRRIRANLDAMERGGAQVEYRALDVRDADAFAALIDEIYARWGRLDGVIHGAGVVADRLVRAKSLESFQAVFDTKVVAACVLAERLRPEHLRFLLFFSSVSGRFGTPGQCDYSAANEVLNKLANRLNRQWSGVHVAAINWGPWEGGMVTEEIGRYLQGKDIQLIPRERGVAACLDELDLGPQGDAEIVISTSVDALAQVALRQAPVLES